MLLFKAVLDCQKLPDDVKCFATKRLKPRRHQAQLLPSGSMRTICPAPGLGIPKPLLETYSLPSGPKVRAVGNVRLEATVLSVQLPLTNTTLPEPAAVSPDWPGVVSVSRANIWPCESNSTPTTVVSPAAATWRLPLGVIL